ncbi:MAG: hypothetical protein ABFR36_10040, partial [Acidobacteriota bacterium]
AAVIISGKKKNDPESIATLWVIPGEPVTSIAVPLWVEAGSTSVPLYEGETAPLYKESFRLKDLIHPFKEGSKKNYLNTSVLLNREGTGFLKILLETEKKIFNETAKFLANKHTPQEYAAFQTKMTELALNTLKQIK